MSLPAEARRRWGLDAGGGVGYLDLGDAIVVVPGGIEHLRARLIQAVDEETWRSAAAGFGDPDLASE